MNGETENLCRMVVEARRALNENKEFKFLKDKYVREIEFHFIPRKTFFIKKEKVVFSAEEWYKVCIEKGVIDFKLLMPTKVDNRQILGFANTNRSSIVCFNKNNEVTYFVAIWKFDQNGKVWEILYQEYIWMNVPTSRPTFFNNEVEFKKVLLEIEELANKIGQPVFAQLFHKAYDALNGQEDLLKVEYLPQISKEYKRFYAAAYYADVFGAMGSWNDSPPCAAEDAGLGDDYDRLSDELLKQIRLGILYAVNECK